MRTQFRIDVLRSEFGETRTVDGPVEAGQNEAIRKCVSYFLNSWIFIVCRTLTSLHSNRLISFVLEYSHFALKKEGLD